MTRRKRIALIGLGMAVTPHAKSLMDLADRVEVVHAISPSRRRRGVCRALRLCPGRQPRTGVAKRQC